MKTRSVSSQAAVFFSQLGFPSLASENSEGIQAGSRHPDSSESSMDLRFGAREPASETVPQRAWECEHCGPLPSCSTSF